MGDKEKDDEIGRLKAELRETKEVLELVRRRRKPIAEAYNLGNYYKKRQKL